MLPVRVGIVAITLAAACLLAGCERPSAKSPAPAQRVAALMPSIAEDLYAIGAGPSVVAVSSFTDVPQAKGLPRVADFTSVDAEKIVALKPDLVVGIPAQSRLVAPLERAGIHVVLLKDDSYDEIFANLRTIGALTGRDKEAAALIAKLQSKTMLLHARTRSFTRKPTVFVVLGSGPIWTAGSSSYIASLIDIAGGVNAANDLHAAYGQYSAEALLRAQPDVIVTDPAIHLDAVLDREPWRSLKAVQAHRVYSVQPAAMLERPGPYYNEGIQWLVDRLTPISR